MSAPALALGGILLEVTTVWAGEETLPFSSDTVSVTVYSPISLNSNVMVSLLSFDSKNASEPSGAIAAHSYDNAEPMAS